VAQHDPLVTYKTRGHEMFQELLGGIQGDMARTIFHMAIRREPVPTPGATAASAPRAPIASTSGTATSGGQTAPTIKQAPSRQITPPSQFAHVPQSPMAKIAAQRPGAVSKPVAKVAGAKVGRNDPCPCGSGKKYKHCCGK
jgi:preprotein translocase subunit SecA